MGTKIDKVFTKGLGQVLFGAKTLYDHGIDKGWTTPEELRLTVLARQARAKERTWPD